MSSQDLDSQLGLQRNVVFVEDNAIVHVELRYIAQTDRRYLRNAVFDPTKFQLSHSYEKLFEKGSWLRSMKREKGSLVLAASPLTSAVQQTHVTHPFEPFTDWTVARKDQQWDLAVSAMGITQTLPMLDDDRLKLVNPQAAPRVLEWATTLPPFNNSSIREECSVTNHTASLTLEVPDIGAISTNEELITINDVQETETPVITSYVGSMLQPVEAAGPALYQSRSLMTSSPQATDGSSLYADRPKYVSPCFNSPGPIKGKPLPSEASGFDDVDPIGDECEQHHNKIKATLLATCILRPTVNASLASHSPEKVSYGQANSPDDELFGEVFSPSGNRQDTPRQETFDLLSASPREFASGSQLLTPILTSFTQNSTLSGEKMIPKAPVPRSKQCSRGIDSRTREKICDYIFQMLEPLRFYRGIVSMRVEIGKFWFTKINWQHISIPGLRQISKAKTIEDMEKSLEKHAVPRDMYFNNIFSLFSGDANLVSNVLGDDEVSKMWLPNSRTAVYEFWCMTKTATGLKTYFSLEVDARTFQYKLRREGTQESNVYVHCAKRDFDFRVVVDATSDIRESYEPFAREVVSSLKVT